MAIKKKKECGYRIPKTGNPCGKGAKYGTAGAPRCKSHDGKRNKRVSKKTTVKAKKSKTKALKKKSKKTVSKRGSASAKTRKTKKTKTKKTASKSKKGKKGKKRPHTKTKISFYDVKSGKNIMVPRESCKIKRNKSTRGGDRIICMHKGRKYSTFVARGFKL